MLWSDATPTWLKGLRLFLILVFAAGWLSFMGIGLVEHNAYPVRHSGGFDALSKIAWCIMAFGGGASFLIGNKQSFRSQHPAAVFFGRLIGLVFLSIAVAMMLWAAQHSHAWSASVMKDINDILAKYINNRSQTV